VEKIYIAKARTLHIILYIKISIYISLSAMQKIYIKNQCIKYNISIKERCDDEYIAGEKPIVSYSISHFFVCLNFFSKKYQWNKNSLFSVLQLIN